MSLELEAALHLASRGLRILPCGVDTDKPDGKAPHTRHAAATTDETVIRSWWNQWPDATVAIRTGEGIFALDIDGELGRSSLASLEAKHGPLPPTLTNITCRDEGGEHRVFSCGAAKIKTTASVIAPKLDVRGDGNGYIIFAPSIHKLTGRRYRCDNPDAPIAPAPQWLLDLVEDRREPKKKSEPKARGIFADLKSAPSEPYVAAAVRSECEAVATAAEGTRNTRLNKAAFSLGTLVGAGRLDRDYAERKLTDAALEAGLGETETATTIRSGLGKGEENPREVRKPLTDLGNAERFADEHRKHALHVRQMSAWMIWDGKVWRRDETNAVQMLAKQTIRGIYSDTAASTSDEARSALAKWAMKSESRAAIGAMISLAESELAATPSQFDQHLDLLNTESGVIDLRTGGLRPHRREDYFTKITPIAFDPTAKRDRWEQFLIEVFCGDAELVAWMKRAIGYSLTGRTREQCFFVLHGNGKNGKGRLVRQLMALLGNAARTTAFSTFTIDRARETGNTPSLAALRGARLVVAGEPDEGVRLSESTIKSMTGEDEIEACAKYEAPITFTPQAKIYLHVNHRPEIRGTDDGIWRRPRMVPFAAKFDGLNGNPAADELLDEKLDAERPGILAWAVEGAREWYRIGLGRCAAVDDATRDYKVESDALAPFCEECLQLGVASDFVSNAVVYAAYTAWCSRNGVEPWRGMTLSKRLVARGYRAHKQREERGFLGVRLRERSMLSGVRSAP